MKTPTALLRLNSARRQLDAAVKTLDLVKLKQHSHPDALRRGARCADDCVQVAAKLRTALQNLTSEP